MEVFEYYKSFEHKLISKGKYTRFFLRLAGIAVGYFNRKVKGTLSRGFLRFGVKNGLKCKLNGFFPHTECS